MAGRCKRAHQAGLTLIELMIALAVGLVVMLALSMVFFGSNSARREVELSAEAIENGRHAIDILTREMAQAGYYGTLGQVGGIALPAGDVCKPTVTTIGSSLVTHAMAYLPGAYPTCIADRVKPGTHVLYTQRASTCAVGEANCAAEVMNLPYLQVSECGSEYGATPFLVAQGQSGNAVFKLRDKACVSTQHSAPRALLRRLYFVDINNELVYQELSLPGFTDPAPVLVSEGIEDMRLQFAVDANGNGSIDSGELVATPADWRGVIGLRVALLSISRQPGTSSTGTRSFDLAGNTVLRADDRFKRRAYSTVILFETPALRGQS
jgi:type IV pilus assembly protein PilW